MGVRADGPCLHVFALQLDLFFGPEIAHGAIVCLIDGQIVVYRSKQDILAISVTPVHSENNCTKAFFEVSHHRAGVDVGDRGVLWVATVGAHCLLAKHVLVNRDELLVLEYVFGIVRQELHIPAKEKRSFGDGPESKLSLLLFLGEQAVANQKDIWVVPVSFCGRPCTLLVAQKVRLDVLPYVGLGLVVKDWP